MERVLIVKADVEYAANNAGEAEAAVTPDLLASGSLGVYGIHRHADGFEKFSLITLGTTQNTPGAYKAADDVYNGKDVTFYVGIGDGQGRNTQAVQLRGIERIQDAAFVEPEAFEVAITVDTVPAIQDYQSSWSLTIVTRSDRHNYIDRETYEAVGEFANAAAVATELAAQINDRQDSVVTAEAAGAVLTITAKEFGKSFDVATDGNLVAAVQSVTPFINGSGYWTDVLRKEKISYTGLGYFDQVDRRMKAVQDLVEGGTEYDLYILEYTNIRNLKDETDDKFHESDLILLAFEGGSNPGALAFETIFEQFKADGKIPGEVELETGSTTTTESTTTE